ncbi:hypothetical protein PRIPAC_78799 [Pristionchus pacificus]|uniref:Uncharacterized protein n=1 Tax=Pristionchus pacificus TaxID=54126 RepID=A0A454Y6V7_PRIPA|nr:hypothetical protein PRIPAC_78799 [Pristionchus pacificus]|eukprot:PDM79615.1 hypothetical protein PRIPAC_32194 [Pristionchus pacificus]
METFNGNDPKYTTCCCGAHITTLARVFIIIDLISVICTGSFIFLVPLLIVGLGVYGVFKQSRGPLFFYVILGVIFSMLSILIALALVATDNFKITITTIEDDGSKTRQEAPKEILYIAAILYVIGIAIKMYFTYVYWKMCKFIRDRELAQGAVPPVYYVKA